MSDLLSTQQVALAAGCSAAFVRTLRDWGLIVPTIPTSKVAGGKSAPGPVTPDLYDPSTVDIVVSKIDPKRHPTSRPEQWRRRPVLAKTRDAGHEASA